MNNTVLICNSLYTIGRRNDLVILKPYPLQFEGAQGLSKLRSQNTKWQNDMKLDQFEQNEIIATKRLKNYYKKLGFKILEKEMMALILSSRL